MYVAHARIALPVKWLRNSEAFIQVVVHTHDHPKTLAMLALANDSDNSVMV